jgi:hypothetical protein
MFLLSALFHDMCWANWLSSGVQRVFKKSALLSLDSLNAPCTLYDGQLCGNMS